MMLQFLLMAAELPNRVVPHGLGVQSGECFTSIRDGERTVRGTHYHSRFWFDRDYALEACSAYDEGGVGVYKRYGTEWCILTRGGGALGETDLVQFGVPTAVAYRIFRLSAIKANDHR